MFPATLCFGMGTNRWYQPKYECGCEAFVNARCKCSFWRIFECYFARSLWGFGRVCSKLFIDLPCLWNRLLFIWICSIFLLQLLNMDCWRWNIASFSCLQLLSITWRCHHGILTNMESLLNIPAACCNISALWYNK